MVSAFQDDEHTGFGFKFTQQQKDLVNSHRRLAGLEEFDESPRSRISGLWEA
jgi:hypothetical protein